MAFERFDRTLARARIAVPSVHITTSKQAYFNRPAIDSMLPNGTRCVELFWDAETRQIGFRPSKKLMVNGYCVSKATGNRRSLLVSMSGFIRRYNLHDRTGRAYRPTKQSNGMVTINVDEPMSEKDLNDAIMAQALEASSPS